MSNFFRTRFSLSGGAKSVDFSVSANGAIAEIASAKSRQLFHPYLVCRAFKLSHGTTMS